MSSCHRRCSAPGQRPTCRRPRRTPPPRSCRPPGPRCRGSRPCRRKAVVTLPSWFGAKVRSRGPVFNKVRSSSRSGRVLSMFLKYGADGTIAGPSNISGGVGAARRGTLLNTALLDLTFGPNHDGQGHDRFRRQGRDPRQRGPGGRQDRGGGVRRGRRHVGLCPGALQRRWQTGHTFGFAHDGKVTTDFGGEAEARRRRPPGKQDRWRATPP